MGLEAVNKAQKEIKIAIEIYKELIKLFKIKDDICDDCGVLFIHNWGCHCIWVGVEQ